MSRMHALKARPKRTLAALATALVAVGITAASGADFTATSANPGNLFASGTLKILNSDEGEALFNATNMRPGDTVQGSVSIKNDGTLSGDFTLTTSAVDSDAANKLSEELNVSISEDGTEIYDGPLADADLDLGSWAAGEQHSYSFDVTLPSTAGDAYQGDDSSVTFDWDAA